MGSLGGLGSNGFVGARRSELGKSKGKIHSHEKKIWTEEGAGYESDDSNDKFYLLPSFNRHYPSAYETLFLLNSKNLDHSCLPKEWNIFSRPSKDARLGVFHPLNYLTVSLTEIDLCKDSVYLFSCF